MSPLFVSMEAGIGLSSLNTLTSSTAFTVNSNNKAIVSDTSGRFHDKCEIDGRHALLGIMTHLF
jgi:hypothetical protein